MSQALQWLDMVYTIDGPWLNIDNQKMAVAVLESLQSELGLPFEDVLTHAHAQMLMCTYTLSCVHVSARAHGP